MIALVVAVVCFVLMCVFAAGCFFLGNMVRTARTDARRDFEDERGRFKLVLDDERARHAAEIERMQQAHAKVVEQLAHTVQYGTPTAVPAVVKDEEPDAESRLLNGISADMVAEGGRRIQRMYEAIGQVVSLEECEAEARAMLHGVAPDIPPERMGLAGLGALQDGPALVKES